MTIAISPIPTCCRWNWTQAWVEEIAKSLPELPDEKKARFMRAWDCRPMTPAVLVAERELADYYEELAQGRGRQGRRQLAEQ